MLKGAVLLRTTALTLALMCANVVMAVADVLNIKSDAPKTYVVSKGDTLWDISNIFLDKPWLWPELWRNNIQIENPHLIYPGDTLQLRYENGKPVIELVRDTSNDRNKNTVVLSPESRVVSKPNPISVLPWSLLSPFIKNDSMMEAEQYRLLPTLLGDNLGTPRFTHQDYVLAHKLPDTNASYQVVRKVREVIDSSGKNLGLQISHLSDAEVSTSLSNERQIVHLTVSTIEAKQGDKLKPRYSVQDKDLTLAPAKAQVGELVQNVNGNALMSSKDIVIVNLGAKQVSPGTVFGIYQQGPDIIANDDPKYADNESLLDAFSFA
ncbi:MAG: hypothetical protein ACJA0G_000136, partial [Kangiellaceae bacterium]